MKDYNSVRPPAKTATIETISIFLRDMLQACAQSEQQTLRVNWLAGDALTAARKKLQRGEWGAYRHKLKWKGKKLSESQATLLRNIRHRITEEQSRVLSYSDALAIVYPSFKRDHGIDVADQRQRRSGKALVKTPSRALVPARRRIINTSDVGATDTVSFAEFFARIKRARNSLAIPIIDFSGAPKNAIQQVYDALMDLSRHLRGQSKQLLRNGASRAA